MKLLLVYWWIQVCAMVDVVPKTWTKCTTSYIVRFLLQVVFSKNWHSYSSMVLLLQLAHIAPVHETPVLTKHDLQLMLYTFEDDRLCMRTTTYIYEYKQHILYNYPQMEGSYLPRRACHPVLGARIKYASFRPGCYNDSQFKHSLSMPQDLPFMPQQGKLTSWTPRWT